jgi:hypothetical protein
MPWTSSPRGVLMKPDRGLDGGLKILNIMILPLGQARTMIPVVYDNEINFWLNFLSCGRPSRRLV